MLIITFRLFHCKLCLLKSKHLVIRCSGARSYKNTSGTCGPHCCSVMLQKQGQSTSINIAVNAPKDCQKASFHLMPAPLILLQSNRNAFHQKYFYFSLVSTKQPSWVSCCNEKKTRTHIWVMCIAFGDMQENENVSEVYKCSCFLGVKVRTDLAFRYGCHGIHMGH